MADELDEALERFQKGGLEYGGGLSNHGPMAAEALVQLGHRALVPGFADRYAPRLGLPPTIGRSIPRHERSAALGQLARQGDWLATWLDELENAPWRLVLRRELPFLIDGLLGGATHGLLRTAHAVRALEAGESPVRLRELAYGLAYWSVVFEKLPELSPPRATEAQEREPTAAELLEQVPLVPREKRKAGLFTAAVRELVADRGFGEAVARAALPARRASIEEWIASLCEFGAKQYLANPTARIAYVHCVTAPHALRALVPFLDESARMRAAFRALQAVAALHAISGGGAASPDAEVERAASDLAEIRYRAACSMEEHAIKFAAAALEEHRRADGDTFRLAAADAALRLQDAGGRMC